MNSIIAASLGGGGDTFLEIAIILAMAVAVGMVGQKLRQPLIIMFLATGVLAGPACFGVIQSHEQIALMAEVGIAILLFIVGLKLDLNLIRTTGVVAMATGVGQIVFTSAIGFFIALVLGMDYLTSAYVAVALTFSSTIIIVKLLSDKKEIDALHGQIAIGFLIVQDIAAIVALVALTTIGQTVGDDTNAWLTTLVIAGKALVFLAVIGLLMSFVIPRLVNKLAASIELLVLAAVAWAVFLAASSDWLGFSKEVGAFMAGISLASTSFRDAIGARLTSLRDFLLLFFFIDLGARLDWSTVGAQLIPSLILSVFVLVGNPLIVLAIMGFMGYRRRTGFLAGLTVAQISEFSLIVAALGLSIGHISTETVGLVTLVGVITIFISTYMILYSGPLYERLSGYLKIFERKDPYRESQIDHASTESRFDMILLGLGGYGSGLAEELQRRGVKMMGVDFNPQVASQWKERGVEVLYGDMADPEMHEHLPLKEVTWVVSSVRSRQVNLSFLSHLRERGFKGLIALTASNRREAEEFKAAGVHLVLQPFLDATEQAADSLTYVTKFLPDEVDWPVSFIEVRVRSDAFATGESIGGLGLFQQFGTTILAVSRAGKMHFDPTIDFTLYPNDRLLLMGQDSALRDAENYLNAPSEQALGREDDEYFTMAKIELAKASELAGKSLADLKFRQRFGVTLAGLLRGEEKITEVSPQLTIQPGDCLVVIGTSSAVSKLKAAGPL